MERTRQISFVGPQKRTIFSDGKEIIIGCQKGPPKYIKNLIKKKYKPAWYLRFFYKGQYKLKKDIYNNYITAIDEIISQNYKFDPKRVDWSMFYTV